METTTTDSTTQPEFVLLNIRTADRKRFGRLAKRDVRGLADEFTIIVAEALEARGMNIDPSAASDGS